MAFAKWENMPALDEHAVNVIVETPKGQASKYKIRRRARHLPTGEIFAAWSRVSLRLWAGNQRTTIIHLDRPSHGHSPDSRSLSAF